MIFCSVLGKGATSEVGDISSEKEISARGVTSALL